MDSWVPNLLFRVGGWVSRLGVCLEKVETKLSKASALPVAGLWFAIIFTEYPKDRYNEESKYSGL